MKIYTLLESKKGLIKIITYPENPDSGMKLFYDTYARGKSESVLPAEDIRQYMQAQIYGQLIGKDLAIAIANDYPLLFVRPLEFPDVNPVPSFADKIFSCLSGDLKSYAENHLNKLDELIARNPEVMKFKIDRADLLCNSGEYHRAKSEYIILVPLCKENGHFKSKIKQGMSTCDRELAKSTTIFQTPFSVEVENQTLTMKQPQHLNENNKNTIKNNSSILFIANSTANQANSENIVLSESLSLSFKNDEDFGVSFSIIINSNKEGHMFISETNKQKLISCHNNPNALISLLKTLGETARKMGERIELHLATQNQQSIKMVK